jgi:hypothetical protein
MCFSDDCYSRFFHSFPNPFPHFGSPRFPLGWADPLDGSALQPPPRAPTAPGPASPFAAGPPYLAARPILGRTRVSAPTPHFGNPASWPPRCLIPSRHRCTRPSPIPGPLGGPGSIHTLPGPGALHPRSPSQR